jgi:16S rRNA G966 N2-methylase RsmD
MTSSTGKEHQGNLELQQEKKGAGPVECLGLTFENEQARREHFTALLKEKLQDPEFRKTPGFPQGSDEAILRMSDPPYYTACPNPFIDQVDTAAQVPDNAVSPYVGDVSEGKNDPIYNAHSYHTKVPHRAIIRYILHYTRPGDLILDPFAGTGMTGVAASECGNYISELAMAINAERKALDLPPAEWGERKAVLGDLSPAATFIASRFNTPTDAAVFHKAASDILDAIERKYGWMYKTKHLDGRSGKIHYTLWSDVIGCPHCAGEIVFWHSAIDSKAGSVKDIFECPHCAAEVTKGSSERIYTTFFDKALDRPVRQFKQVPVVINYSVEGSPGRFEKEPDDCDIKNIEEARSIDISDWYPKHRMPEGGETRRNDDGGITHIHHFYTWRNLAVLASIWSMVLGKLPHMPTLGLWFTSTHAWGTRLNRLLTSNYFKRKGGVIGQTLQGTLYVSSLSVETNLIERFRLRISSCPHTSKSRSALVYTGSAESNLLQGNSIDYIFTDPPFGANIQYSELNTLWEAWLDIFTEYKDEAVQNRARAQSLARYQELMEKAFKECYRVLKPGRWMTVEFSNTKASVWNAIQEAIQKSGFVVASVAALEKSHKGYRAVTTVTAVKQDLVITAYKPTTTLLQAFEIEKSSEEVAWAFIREHLRNAPVNLGGEGRLKAVSERTAHLLFDRLVAFFVQRGVQVPISSPEFIKGLSSHFSVRDGMYFLPDQVAKYDKLRSAVDEIEQLDLFVSDEATAIQWVRQQLSAKPQSQQDLHPLFTKELSSWSKYEQVIELGAILSQSFLYYEGKSPMPSQIHSYLSSNYKDLRRLDKSDPLLISKSVNRWYVPDPSKQADLEKMREKTLIKEFEEYKQSTQRKLKVFRAEAVRAGFKACWQEKDYATIVKVAAKLPEAVLQEDEKLLMYIDNAQTRLGDDA